MKASILKQELIHIFDAQESEISCSVCFDRLAEYVDRVVAGDPAGEHMPEVKHHIEHCRVCGEEYAVLSELAQLEKQGRLPKEDETRRSL